MELATRQRGSFRRPVLTHEGWRVLGLRRRAFKARTFSVRYERMPGHSICIVPLYGNPLFGVDYIGNVLHRRWHRLP